VGETERKQRKAQSELNSFFNSTDQLPISRDQFLKKVMPDRAKRPADLADLFKRFLRERLIEENSYVHRISKNPTDEEVDIAYDKFGPLGDLHGANVMGLRFTTWYQEDVKESRRAAGRESAAQKQQEVAPSEIIPANIGK
jgi:hypothetical protein